MFNKVLILNRKGKLKRLLTTEMLSKRHWELFEDDSKLNPKKNKEQKKRQKKRKAQIFDIESFGFEGF